MLLFQQVLVCGSAKLFSEQVAKATEAIKVMQDEARKEPGCFQFLWTLSLEDPLMVLIYEVYRQQYSFLPSSSGVVGTDPLSALRSSTCFSSVRFLFSWSRVRWTLSFSSSDGSL